MNSHAVQEKKRHMRSDGVNKSNNRVVRLKEIRQSTRTPEPQTRLELFDGRYLN